MLDKKRITKIVVWSIGDYELVDEVSYCLEEIKDAVLAEVCVESQFLVGTRKKGEKRPIWTCLISALLDEFVECNGVEYDKDGNPDVVIVTRDGHMKHPDFPNLERYVTEEMGWNIMPLSLIETEAEDRFMIRVAAEAYAERIARSRSKKRKAAS